MLIYDLLNVYRDEPGIVNLPEPIRMIGVSTRTTMRSILRDSQDLGKRYKAVKAAGLVEHKREPWAFVAVSKDFARDGSWEYLMGDVVTCLDTIPEGLSGFEIPRGTYAKFHLQPRSVLLWGAAMGLLKRYIYTEWLPKSKYVADTAVVGDFEYHDERSLSRRPAIDLFVAVRPKDAPPGQE